MLRSPPPILTNYPVGAVFGGIEGERREEEMGR